MTTHEKQPKRVVTLVRVSTRGQAADDRGGLDRQRRAISETVARHSLRVIKSYEIIGVSGTQVLQSPEFQEILTKIRRREIEGVVASDIDRVMRANKPGDYGFLELCQIANVVIYTENAIHDPGNLDGAFISHVFLALAGRERNAFIHRVWKAKEEKRRRGELPSGLHTLTRGVTYDFSAAKARRPAWSYTAEIREVQEAFRLIDEEGLTNLSEVARRVGIDYHTLRNQIKNPLYHGLWVIAKRRGPQSYASRDGRQADRRKVARNEEDVIRVQVIPSEEAAVSWERFARVQGLLGNARKVYHAGRRSPTSVNLGVGVARCGHCGSRLYATSGLRRGGRGNRPGYYLCCKNDYRQISKSGGCRQPSIRKDRLDPALHRFASEHLTRPEVLTSLVEQALRPFHEENARSGARSYDQELQELDRRDKRAREGFMAGVLEADEAAKIREDLRRQRHLLEEERGRRVGIAQARQEIETTVRLLLQGTYAFRRASDALTQRRILNQLFSTVTVKDGSITAFEFSPQFAATIQGIEGAPEAVALVTQDVSRTGRGSSRRRA